MPMRLDQVVDRARRDALDVGLLDHRRQRLLGHAPRLQEAREVAALPELGDAQLDRPGPRLPVPVAVAVALGQPIRALLAIAGAGQPPHLQLHQPLGGKADHLAQQIGVGALLHKRAQGHHVVGHRWFLRSRLAVSNPTLPKDTDDHRSAARSLWRPCGRAREQLRYRQATPLGGTRSSGHRKTEKARPIDAFRNWLLVSIRLLPRGKRRPATIDQGPIHDPFAGFGATGSHALHQGFPWNAV